MREQLVPRVSRAPGFVTGYWTMKDSNGLTMLIFESEEAANAISAQARSLVSAATTPDGIEVREVAPHAPKQSAPSPRRLTPALGFRVREPRIRMRRDNEN